MKVRRRRRDIGGGGCGCDTEVEVGDTQVADGPWDIWEWADTNTTRAG
jgi:hypothetical protein